MNMRDVWRVLGVTATSDQPAIRRAYAVRLKGMDPDADVAGYAALRDARDAALNWARAQAARAKADVEPLELSEPDMLAPAPDTASRYSGPVLDVAPAPGQVTVAPDPSAATAPVVWSGAGQHDSGSGWPLQLSAKSAFGRIVASRSDLVDRRNVRLSPPPDRVLWSLLHEADGKPRVDTFTADEASDAQDSLGQLLRHADSSDLVGREQIENWLAHILAVSWPRSAPLLEQVEACFGWQKERGSLGERPAVAFLNARLHGLRFYEKVSRPDHPLHNAWTELSKPGTANLRSRLQTNSGDVRTLLEGVRKNFPEIETYLAPDKVASWERRLGGVGDGSKAKGPSGWVWIMVAVGILRVLGTLGSTETNQSQPFNPPLPELVATDPAAPPELDQAVKTIFGPAITMETLFTQQPELAQTLISNMRYTPVTDPMFASKMIDLILERGVRASAFNDKVSLAQIMRIKLMRMQAARKSGPSACMSESRTGYFEPAVSLPPQQLARQQALLRKLLDSGMLGNFGSRPAKTATIPGEIVGQVMSKTKLSSGVVRAAMDGKGSDAQLCAVDAALLEATLAWQGADQHAMLEVQ